MIQEPNTVEELIETISAHEVGMPVAEMSRLLEVGAAAAGPVAEAVERWRDDEGRELLWLVVVLGELRRPAGIEPLLDLLQRKGWTELQAAAADALAKIGGPALPALLDRIGAAGPDERVWIYASLGWIGGDDAYAALLAALEDDAEVSGVAALALSDLGRREAIPAIYEALTRSAAWQRPDFETALRALHHGQPTARPQDADWRIRYRRLPRYGHSIPSWAVVAALVLDDPETQREMSDIPVRPLEDIVAEPPEPDEPPQICDDCGAPVEEPTGLPVCPDTALPAALLQVRLLEDAREQGFEFVYELWNDVEVAFPLMEMDEIDPPDWKDEEEIDEEKDTIFVEWSTCHWLASEGAETIAEAKALLLAKAAWLADRFGDPDGLLSPPAPMARESRPGRNDPCPCGSGRKHKLCCGRPGGPKPN